jgi:hypothetical protein
MNKPFYSDKELAKLFGLSFEQWTAASVVLERKGFPKKDPQFNNQRYWRGIQAFLDRRSGVLEVTPEEQESENAIRWNRNSGVGSKSLKRRDDAPVLESSEASHRTTLRAVINKN